MFTSARLKLTAWYLIIIMAVSVLFSLVIYTVINQEYNRIEHVQRIRHEREQQGLISTYQTFLQMQAQQNQSFVPPPPLSDDLQIISEARTRLQAILLLVNLGILGIAGVAGYFLAGRTLRPIKEMVDEQNQFIADASHELRTPLTALRTTIEVNLRDKSLNLNQSKRVLQGNLEEVVGLQNLSDNLLILAKASDVKKDLNIQKVSLNTVVSEAIDKVSVFAGQKKIIINQKISDVIFEGDEEKLVRLLVILLDNAVKYSKSGKAIDITGKSIDHKVKVEIRDQGIGISDDDLPHLFDRFYRADKSRGKTDGYGLGLSIAKKIVDLHQGSICAISKIDKGSIFTILLPKRQA